MSSISRADFLRGTGGGAAVLAGGGIFAAAAAPAAAQSRGDVAILKLAATAELLVIEFLKRAIAAQTSLDEDLLREVLRDERKHYQTFRELLGRRAPTRVQPTFPEGTFASARSIAQLGFKLDTVFTRVYIGAVPRLRSDELSTVAAALAANEAQHLSGWSLVLDRGPIPLGAIPKPLAPAAARRALAPLLGSVQGGQLTG